MVKAFTLIFPFLPPFTSGILSMAVVELSWEVLKTGVDKSYDCVWNLSKER